jgi:hypothetical protein
MPAWPGPGYELAARNTAGAPDAAATTTTP